MPELKRYGIKNLSNTGKIKTKYDLLKSKYSDSLGEYKISDNVTRFFV